MKNNSVPVLSFKNIGKAFGSNWVLRDVSMDIMPGEIHAICGENGAGKSTLMNILFGMPVIQTTGGYVGKILVEGQEVKVVSPEQAIRLGIGMVHQEFMLIPGFTVGENIKLNREPLRNNMISRILGNKLKTVAFGEIRRSSQQTLNRLGVMMDESAMVETLPVGYMQFAEIAREIDKKNTKVLTESEAEIVLQIVRNLSKQGIAVLLITHRISDIMEVADSVTVLRDGRNVKTVSVKGISEREIASLMLGRELDLNSIHGHTSKAKDITALEVKNFSVDMPSERVFNINFKVRQGEILGIGGLAGQGKAGIANGIMGIFPAKGEIQVFGKPMKLNSPKMAIKNKLAFVSEDRRKTGFAPDLSIAENISAYSMMNHNKFLKTFGFFKQVDTRAMNEQTQKYIEEFQIRCTDLSQKVGTLSGGNQQKVCVAAALMLEPDILLVSEPTRGIDVGAKTMVLDTIAKINQEKGVTVIFTSSELSELRQICDRIMIISEGQISEIMAPDASDEEFGMAMSGERRQVFG